MKLHDRHQNTKLVLQSTILVVFVCFVMQGVFSAYASASPDTDAYTILLKDRSAKSSPDLKKLVKLVAVERYTITLDPHTGSSSISRPYSTLTTVLYLTADPSRAPPVPFIQQIP